ncbi:hypothetical protein RN001_014941 [Aquatica leii]|uniref:Peptidase S1 domain-containing protein n=1 Tax=Aquatica leii TaxID=1421715 RepID=A0AAN7SBT2_9COLE|nr:hypothetical protein RN001_014941 [Aquatica leii]
MRALLIVSLSLVHFSYGAEIKVVGGSDAPEGAFPYQASLRKKGKHSCGGSLIGDQWILTAAHCVSKQDASKYTVVVGSNLISKGGDSYDVEEFIPHEKYDPEVILHDIALIKLKNAVKLSDSVKKIELAGEDTPSGKELVLSGWGLTGVGILQLLSPPPNKLQTIKLMSISNDKCAQAHPDGDIKASHLCTFTRIGEGACYGDSGGPLVADGKQVGVVSWGIPCAKGKPDVFTRTYSYLDWISEHIK